MRSNKNRTEQIPRIFSLLFFLLLLSFAIPVWLNCWTCWVALGPFPFTLYVPPEEEPPRFPAYSLPTTGSAGNVPCVVGELTLIDINLGHIVGRLCVCTLLYSELKRRDFLTWRRHTHTHTGREEMTTRWPFVCVCAGFSLRSPRRRGDPLSFGRRRRPSWAGSSSPFSCPCVGKHRDIPTDKQRKRKDSPHRAPVSSALPK